MPIYNEAPARVFGAMQAIFEDVDAPASARRSTISFCPTRPTPTSGSPKSALSSRCASDCRTSASTIATGAKNTSRKAGNIADFVTRWGGHYPQMVVLDADSLMTGETIVRLAAAMEADPDAGIIQSLPLIINRNTLFARLQQFAARIAGPIIAAGLTAWMGRDGNYWGHNAIIRTRAFADHCGLPDLPGQAPVRRPHPQPRLRRGGADAPRRLRGLHAADARRLLRGEPALADRSRGARPALVPGQSAALAHHRRARGFVWASRQHFATGIMGYLASPLWMAQLLVGIVLVLQSHYIRPEYFTADFSLFPAWPRFDYERALQLFELTIAMLLAPKFLGLIVALFDGPTRRGSGGALGLIASTCVEIVISAALAPIMMLIQSGSVAQILSGRDTGWNPQRRDDGSIPFASIVRRHRSHALLASSRCSPPR